MPIAIARERGAFGERRKLGDDVIQHERVAYGDFSRGEFRRLRVDAADFAAVRVVDDEEQDAEQQRLTPGAEADRHCRGRP
jgi:hypothetical protein